MYCDAHAFTTTYRFPAAIKSSQALSRSASRSAVWIVNFVMAAFNIFIRKAGEEGQEVEVTPQTTVGEIKAKHCLKGYAVRFKGPWKDGAKMADLGIKDGETINMCKTGCSAAQKASLRLIKGDTKKSTAHSHLNLHPETQGVVVEAVMAEGQRVSGKMDELRDDVQDMQNILRGKETGPQEGQSDKERFRQIRMLERAWAAISRNAKQNALPK